MEILTKLKAFCRLYTS